MRNGRPSTSFKVVKTGVVISTINWLSRIRLSATTTWQLYNHYFKATLLRPDRYEQVPTKIRKEPTVYEYWFFNTLCILFLTTICVFKMGKCLAIGGTASRNIVRYEAFDEQLPDILQADNTVYSLFNYIEYPLLLTTLIIVCIIPSTPFSPQSSLLKPFQYETNPKLLQDCQIRSEEHEWACV